MAPCPGAWAAGNPLALTELPVTAARIAPGSLPLTQRLEQAFAARVSELPAATQLLLLVAAHSDDEDLGEFGYVTLDAEGLWDDDDEEETTPAPKKTAKKGRR